MRRARVRFMTACFLALTFLAGGAAMGQEYWVSVAGNDSAAGTKDMPFATLERARDAVRETRKAGGLPKGGVTVWLRGGVYEISKTFELNHTDSGTAESLMVVRSVPGEEVRLVGRKQIPSSAFKTVTDPDVLQRLDPAAHGNVLQVELKAVGITDYGQLTRRGGIERSTLPAALELLFNDRPMPLARWPNQGWTRIADVTPAIDAGIAAPAPDHDLEGKARPAGKGCDIGAYEAGGTSGRTATFPDE